MVKSLKQIWINLYKVKNLKHLAIHLNLKDKYELFSINFNFHIG